MKPSHFITPRSLEECVFDPRGQAIFGKTDYSKTMSDTTLLAWFVVLLLVFAIIMAIY